MPGETGTTAVPSFIRALQLRKAVFLAALLKLCAEGTAIAQLIAAFEQKWPQPAQADRALVVIGF